MCHKKIILTLLLLLFPFTFYSKDFPICIYGVDDAIHLKTIKKAGFNCVQVYKKQPEVIAQIAEGAQKHGLKTVFYPDIIINTPEQEKAQNWPVLAWYLYDEPDVHNLSRGELIKKDKAVRLAFPSQKTTFVIGQGKTHTPYYDIADTLMMDWYPVPHLDLASLGAQTALAKAGIEQTGQKNKPLWAVVQAFDWKEFKQNRPDNDRIGRFPATAEMRFMSYDALANGADGLFYFLFTSKNIPLPIANKEHWQRIAAVTKEIAKLEPVFKNGAEIQSPLNLNAPLKSRAWQYKNKTYLLVVNPTAKPITLPAISKSLNFKLLYPKDTETKNLFKQEPAIIEAYQALVLVK